MKFKLRITKDVLKKSSNCGRVGGVGSITRNCAFALAFNELVPNVAVTEYNVIFYKPESSETFAKVPTSTPIVNFIIKFDTALVSERLEFPEQEFDVEIPDNVINFYYGDTVKAVQKLINNPVLIPVISENINS